MSSTVPEVCVTSNFPPLDECNGRLLHTWGHATGHVPGRGKWGDFLEIISSWVIVGYNFCISLELDLFLKKSKNTLIFQLCWKYTLTKLQVPVVRLRVVNIVESVLSTSSSDRQLEMFNLFSSAFNTKCQVSSIKYIFLYFCNYGRFLNFHLSYGSQKDTR